MGLITSLLPGVRDLRVPMSAGLLWLGVAVVLLAPRADRILAPSPEAQALTKLVQSWPASLVVPVTVGAAFLLGMIANATTQHLTRRAGSAAQRLVRNFELDGYRHLIPGLATGWPTRSPTTAASTNATA